MENAETESLQTICFKHALKMLYGQTGESFKMNANPEVCIHFQLLGCHIYMSLYQDFFFSFFFNHKVS